MEIPSADDDLFERKWETLMTLMHAVAISIDNNRWQDHNSSRCAFANSSVTRPNLLTCFLKKLAKKTAN